MKSTSSRQNAAFASVTLYLVSLNRQEWESRARYQTSDSDGQDSPTAAAWPRSSAGLKPSMGEGDGTPLDEAAAQPPSSVHIYLASHDFEVIMNAMPCGQTRDVESVIAGERMPVLRQNRRGDNVMPIRRITAPRLVC